MAISSRLQQLVDSVAVEQIGKIKRKSPNNLGKSNSPDVITISDTPSPNSPPALISSTVSLPSVIQVPGISSFGDGSLSEDTIIKSIEGSRKYREFVLKHATSRRLFQKQMDKKVANAPYPKTFRQVWPIIPVQDPLFLKNLGLETVTMYFDPNWKSNFSRSLQSSKAKPVCNQCGCDFASAWQIRKNNSKQVLLCESCDFTNLKVLQRTKLGNQLKDLMDGVKKEEGKFYDEFESGKRQIVAAERAITLNQWNKARIATQIGDRKSHDNHMTTANHTKGSVSLSSQIKERGVVNQTKDRVTIPSLLSSSHERVSYLMSSKLQNTAPVKRQSNQDTANIPRKSTKVDSTLNHLTQQLLIKQVDEKCKKHRQTLVPSPTPQILSSTTTPPPPPLQPMATNDVSTGTGSNTGTGSGTSSGIGSGIGFDSRKNRRKGKPRQNRFLSNSSVTE